MEKKEASLMSREESLKRRSAEVEELFEKEKAGTGKDFRPYFRPGEGLSSEIC